MHHNSRFEHALETMLARLNEVDTTARFNFGIPLHESYISEESGDDDDDADSPLGRMLNDNESETDHDDTDTVQGQEGIEDNQLEDPDPDRLWIDLVNEYRNSNGYIADPNFNPTIIRLIGVLPERYWSEAASPSSSLTRSSSMVPEANSSGQLSLAESVHLPPRSESPSLLTFMDGPELFLQPFAAHIFHVGPPRWLRLSADPPLRARRILDSDVDSIDPASNDT